MLDLDFKVKGLPFLQFEINQVNLKMLQHGNVKAMGFFVKELCLSNVEKREQKNILSSTSNSFSHLYASHRKSMDVGEDSPIKSR